MIHARRCRGMTLPEILVALAIGAALLLLAVPLYRDWIADAELRDRVEALVGAMGLARAEALKRNARVNLCPTDDRRRCAPGGGWENGWLLYADADDDGQPDGAGPPIRVEGPSRPGITIRGNRPVADYVSYTGLGQTRMRNGALQMGTFTVCRAGRAAVLVILANGGRVRVERTRDACP
ncbi:MAG: GspH/FimT family pseudopilin [Burkholderiales bacterium]